MPRIFPFISFLRKPETFQIFSKPDNVTLLKWRVLLHKRFFDTGYSLTNYVKYIIALVAVYTISSHDITRTLSMGVGYFILCWLVGGAWHFYRLAETETEMGNRVNWFVDEMRQIKDKIGK